MYITSGEKCRLGISSLGYAMRRVYGVIDGDIFDDFVVSTMSSWSQCVLQGGPFFFSSESVGVDLPEPEAFPLLQREGVPLEPIFFQGKKKLVAAARICI